ncbi:MAG TPA: hypothetical protein VK793_11390 [Steroidobacteraceae bacterium]|nr:hypothetical protein [Steroidobacteraceae bacterium]
MSQDLVSPTLIRGTPGHDDRPFMNLQGSGTLLHTRFMHAQVL